VHKSSRESNEADADYDAKIENAKLIDENLQRMKEYSEWPVDLQKITTPPEFVGDAISG
jgi:hypothetical protein